jgi:DNA repair protein RadC
MKLKEVELIVKDIEIKYDGREKLIDNFLNESTKKHHTSPDSFKRLLINYFSLFKDEKERFIAILLDTKNRIIGIDLVSVGTISEVPVHPREVFRKAITAGAKSIIIAHNHPSGDVTPSRADIQVSKRIENAGDILDICLLDSLVISTKYGGELLSLKEQRLF